MWGKIPINAQVTDRTTDGNEQHSGDCSIKYIDLPGLNLIMHMDSMYNTTYGNNLPYFIAVLATNYDMYFDS